MSRRLEGIAGTLARAVFLVPKPPSMAAAGLGLVALQCGVPLLVEATAGASAGKSAILEGVVRVSSRHETRSLGRKAQAA